MPNSKPEAHKLNKPDLVASGQLPPPARIVVELVVGPGQIQRLFGLTTWLRIRGVSGFRGSEVQGAERLGVYRRFGVRDEGAGCGPALQIWVIIGAPLLSTSRPML